MEGYLLSSHLEAIRMLGLYISPISWSNSEFLMLGVFCCAPGPVVFRCNSLLSCYLSFWEVSLVGFLWFSHLEAILMFGVFCCAPRPVVFRSNCFCCVGLYISFDEQYWEVVVCPHILKQFWCQEYISPILWSSSDFGTVFFATSWSNSDVGSILLCPWASCVQM